MKHTVKITIILLAMFIITQFIGIYVVNHYSIPGKELPYGMKIPEIQKESDYYGFFSAIIMAFVIAIVLMFLLSKFNWAFIIKLWFFIVIVIALGISFNSFIPLKYSSLIALLIAVPLAVEKVYKRNFLVHNATELFIYPGIAAVFVPILNLFTIIALLILISIYDIWAVWHSGIMQKMAKYQINKLNIFSGFFVPYISKKIKMQMQKLPKSKLKNKKVRANVAILGGGDVVFPIIAAGVILKTSGLIPALFVILGATLGITYLFFFAEKRKFYPAMPYITAGIFLGMLLGRIFG